jgi:hypothetical protein
MHSALPDLNLDRLLILYSGHRRFPLADRAEAVPLAELATIDPFQPLP